MAIPLFLHVIRNKGRTVLIEVNLFTNLIDKFSESRLAREQEERLRDMSANAKG